MGIPNISDSVMLSFFEGVSPLLGGHSHPLDDGFLLGLFFLVLGVRLDSVINEGVEVVGEELLGLLREGDCSAHHVGTSSSPSDEGSGCVVEVVCGHLCDILDFGVEDFPVSDDVVNLFGSELHSPEDGFLLVLGEGFVADVVNAVFEHVNLIDESAKDSTEFVDDIALRLEVLDLDLPEKVAHCEVVSADLPDSVDVDPKGGISAVGVEYPCTEHDGGVVLLAHVNVKVGAGDVAESTELSALFLGVSEYVEGSVLTCVCHRIEQFLVLEYLILSRVDVVCLLGDVSNDCELSVCGVGLSVELILHRHDGDVLGGLCAESSDVGEGDTAEVVSPDELGRANLSPLSDGCALVVGFVVSLGADSSEVEEFVA